VGAGIHRWWRESARLHEAQAEWQAVQELELARAIVHAPRRDHERMRKVVAAFVELWKAIDGKEAR
jgi:hypothetical protein